MAKENKLTWIKTRDGSHTLWHNELGESYRSVKGAYTESLAVFVLPGLKKALQWKKSGSFKRVSVLEFGLGAGHNWMLWRLLAEKLGIDFEYQGIEKDMEAFHMASKRWKSECTQIADFLNKFLANAAALDFAEIQNLHFSPEQIAESLHTWQPPRECPSILEAVSARQQSYAAHIYFHDPFGFDVNPDGYSLENLELLSKLWDSQHFIGLSYASNRLFQRNLNGLGYQVNKLEGPSLLRLKRECLSWTVA